jgi:DNA adenine methylase
VGGKQGLAARLAKYLGPVADSSTYFEPFLGAGSVFLRVDARKAVLGDANGHLIEMYRSVRDHPREVARYVRAFALADSEDNYRQVRAEYNAARRGARRAAMFIYLNRACYNGVFRVNSKGKYNVPWGGKSRLLIPSRACLERMSEKLRTAELEAGDYRSVVRRARDGDTVYLDPPYPPLNGTAYFTHYTKDRFDAADQLAVARLARSLADRGCKVIVTNADTESIRALYDGWHIDTIDVPRYVTGKRRYRVQELVITSPPPRTQEANDQAAMRSQLPKVQNSNEQLTMEEA